MIVSPSLFLAVCGVGTSTSVLDGRLISPPLSPEECQALRDKYQFDKY